jgi:WD40 repeat protein
MTPGANYCEDCGVPLAPELGGVCAACLWGDDDEATMALDLEFGEEIARGGMGIVYRARQANPAREVAAKMLLPRLLDEPGLRERFANEAKVAASLDHPGILPIYAVGESGGVPYFTMKLADGGSLADRLKKEGALPARDAVKLIAAIAEAIHYAHGRGVLHRDLKPGNILFDAAGRTFVSDFGLAKLVDPESGADLTRTIAILGTPQYLPPEIARGSLREASTSGDIYALGAVLHELLAGRPPFEADTVPGLLRRIADEDAKIPETLPRDLRAVLGRCLEKEPARRYATAGELAEDLRAWCAGHPVKARRPGLAERVGRWARRNPVVAALSACLVLVLALGLIGEFRSKARLSESLADSLLAQAALVRGDNGGGARSSALDLLRRSAALTPLPAVDRAAGLRGEAAAALALPSLKRADQWKVPGNWNLVRPAFSVDLTHYAAPAEAGGFALYETATRRSVGDFPLPGKAGATAGKFAFNASRERVTATYIDMTARHSVTEVYAISGVSPSFRGSFEADGIEGAVPVLFMDGSFLAQDGGRIWRGTDQSSLEPFPLAVKAGRLVASTLVLSDDENRLAAAVEDPPGLVVWNLESGDPHPAWSIPLPAIPQCLAWSHDGSRVAFAEGGSAPVDLIVVQASDGELLAKLPGHGSAVTTLAFHPNGDSLASVGFDNWIIWQAIEPGGFRVRLPGNPGPLVFSADGKRLGYSPGRGSLGLAEVALPVGWQRWKNSAGLGTVTCAESTPEGDRLVLATLAGLALWDAKEGRRLAFHPWLGSSVRWPWFRVSRDGDFLVCSDSEFPMTRWPILPGGFGEPETTRSPRGGTDIIQDFAANGRDWLVSGDREQREASAAANFYLWPDGDPTRARLIAAGARANGLFFIPPGTDSAIAFHSHQVDARLWDCVAAREIRMLGHPEPVFLGVSRDGKRVCTIGAAEGRLWNTGDWSQLASWSQEVRGKSVPVFSPDGASFATTTPAGQVFIRRSLDGASVLELAPPRDLTTPELLWLGNDRLLLVSALDGIHEWNLADLKAASAREGVPW